MVLEQSFDQYSKSSCYIGSFRHLVLSRIISHLEKIGKSCSPLILPIAGKQIPEEDRHSDTHTCHPDSPDLTGLKPSQDSLTSLIFHLTKLTHFTYLTPSQTLFSHFHTSLHLPPLIATNTDHMVLAITPYRPNYMIHLKPDT